MLVVYPQIEIEIPFADQLACGLGMDQFFEWLRANGIDVNLGDIVIHRDSLTGDVIVKGCASLQKEVVPWEMWVGGTANDEPIKLVGIFDGVGI